MNVDAFGIAHISTQEICTLLYENPEVNIHSLQVDDPEEFNRSLKTLYYNCAPLTKYAEHVYVNGRTFEEELAEFDVENQSEWFMPESYKKFDIAEWVLKQCRTDEEVQRVGKELLMFQERGMIVLLQFMKFFVDTMRKHNVIWGVGRGSSVASYVLFLIGVHKIDSLYYDLDIEEFLK